MNLTIIVFLLHQHLNGVDLADSMLLRGFELIFDKYAERSQVIMDSIRSLQNVFPFLMNLT